MLKLARMGVVIAPAMPAFYTHPQTLDDAVTFSVTRLLDHLGIPVAEPSRWTGEMNVQAAKRERP
jgi:4-hydroxy-3-polyprenylbenzoate decarboxylase